MNSGKSIFAQLMDFLPLKLFDAASNATAAITN